VPKQAVRRRLATIYFIDIVGSTALATELGDARWNALLTRFRRLVRAELKRYGGREQDTAGDGFFATFGEPAQSLRAAVAVAAAVQELGVDIRTGIHTGEVEEIDSKLGGIAVHVGARVMGLAGAAEVLVTNTVRDLVSGSDATFEDRGVHELKGVEGSRQIFALTAVVTRLPQPLSPEEAAERLAHVVPARLSSRSRVLVAASAALVLVAIAGGGWLAFRGGGASAAEGIDLLRLDARTDQVATLVHGKPTGSGLYSNLWSRDGTLWQMQGGHFDGRLVARDIDTGTPGKTIDLGADACSCKVAFGFGSVWLAKSHTALQGPRSGETVWTVERIDALSGRHLRTYTLPGNGSVSTIAAGNGAVWVLQPDANLLRIDPISNRVTGTWNTHAVETTILVPLRGYEWICECTVNKIMRFDARTGRSRTFSIPEQAFLIDVSGPKVYLLDPEHATVTPMDPGTGKLEPPLGLSGAPQQGVIANGAAWIAAGPYVERIDVSNDTKKLIDMPAGVWAGSIASDPRTHSLWVGNSRFPPPQQ
jgi:class 3 adenylate cyclase/streptogramin lyase